MAWIQPWVGSDPSGNFQAAPPEHCPHAGSQVSPQVINYPELSSGFGFGNSWEWNGEELSRNQEFSYSPRSEERGLSSQVQSFGSAREASSGSETEGPIVLGRSRRKRVTRYRAPCACCGGDHPLWECHRFRGITPSSRRSLVREAELCFVCLRPNHETSECPQQPWNKCWIQGCYGGHHHLLHPEMEQTEFESAESEVVAEEKDRWQESEEVVEDQAREISHLADWMVAHVEESEQRVGSLQAENNELQTKLAELERSHSEKINQQTKELVHLGERMRELEERRDVESKTTLRENISLKERLGKLSEARSEMAREMKELQDRVCRLETECKWLQERESPEKVAGSSQLIVVKRTAEDQNLIEYLLRRVSSLNLENRALRESVGSWAWRSEQSWVAAEQESSTSSLIELKEQECRWGDPHSLTEQGPRDPVSDFTQDQEQTGTGPRTDADLSLHDLGATGQMGLGHPGEEPSNLTLTLSTPEPEDNSDPRGMTPCYQKFSRHYEFPSRTVTPTAGSSQQAPRETNATSTISLHQQAGTTPPLKQTSAPLGATGTQRQILERIPEASEQDDESTPTIQEPRQSRPLVVPQPTGDPTPNRATKIQRIPQASQAITDTPAQALSASEQQPSGTDVSATEANNPEQPTGGPTPKRTARIQSRRGPGQSLDEDQLEIELAKGILGWSRLKDSRGRIFGGVEELASSKE